MDETEVLGAVGDREVAFLCRVATCGENATVMVEHRVRAEQPLCPEHWQEAHVLVRQSLNSCAHSPDPIASSPGAARGRSRSWSTPTDRSCRAVSPTGTT